MNHNWPSHYTYYGRYEDTGVTDRIFEYVTKTGKKNITILDVGCSIGLAAKSLKNNVLSYGIHAQTIGIDVSTKVQEEARNNLDKFILGDILKVEIKPEFDVVICSKIIFFESAKRKAMVLSKCSELLKQDGGLITDAHSYDFPTTRDQAKEDISDIKKIILKLKFGPKAVYHEVKSIMEFRFKRKIKLIMGKEESLKYSNKILNDWKKLDSFTKFSYSLDIMLGKFSAHMTKNPNYKKRGKNHVITS